MTSATQHLTVPAGREAAIALRDVIAECKDGDPLAPVTVVVPSTLAGLSLRRLLASGGLDEPGDPVTGIANVGFTVVGRLLELLGAADARRRGTPAHGPGRASRGDAGRAARRPGHLRTGRPPPRHRAAARRHLHRAAPRSTMPPSSASPGRGPAARTSCACSAPSRTPRRLVRRPGPARPRAPPWELVARRVDELGHARALRRPDRRRRSPGARRRLRWIGHRHRHDDVRPGARGYRRRQRLRRRRRGPPGACATSSAWWRRARHCTESPSPTPAPTTRCSSTSTSPRRGSPTTAKGCRPWPRPRQAGLCSAARSSTTTSGAMTSSVGWPRRRCCSPTADGCHSPAGTASLGRPASSGVSTSGRPGWPRSRPSCSPRPRTSRPTPSRQRGRSDDARTPPRPSGSATSSSGWPTCSRRRTGTPGPSTSSGPRDLLLSLIGTDAAPHAWPEPELDAVDRVLDTLTGLVGARRAGHRPSIWPTFRRAVERDLDGPAPARAVRRRRVRVVAGVAAGVDVDAVCRRRPGRGRAARRTSGDDALLPDRGRAARARRCDGPISGPTSSTTTCSPSSPPHAAHASSASRGPTSASGRHPPAVALVARHRGEPWRATRVYTDDLSRLAVTGRSRRGGAVLRRRPPAGAVRARCSTATSAACWPGSRGRPHARPPTRSAEEPSLGAGLRAHRRPRARDAFTAFDGNVDSRPSAPRLAPIAPLSPTALETYATCPRRYLLRPRAAGCTRTSDPRSLEQIAAGGRGQLVHRVLER